MTISQKNSPKSDGWASSRPAAAFQLERVQSLHTMMETPCPYLPGQYERKLFTELRGPDAARIFDTMTRAGFRRSHNFAYRPACQTCQACVPVRVPVERFKPSRSQRRSARQNTELQVSMKPVSATAEQYSLFVRYLAARHADGEMSRMTFQDYAAMVEDTCLRSALAEFREPTDGSLAAVLLVDWLADGASAVYSFFDTASSRKSLGSYLILWLIDAVRRAGLDKVYLGYWIDQSPKMAYKARFKPLEALGPNGWHDIAGEDVTVR